MQRAILNSFLMSYVGTCQSVADVERDAFVLDVTIFKTPLEKRIAEKINDETNGEKAYSVLDVEIEEKVRESNSKILQDEYIEIVSYSPMQLSRAKILHDRIVARKKMAELS